MVANPARKNKPSAKNTNAPKAKRTSRPKAKIGSTLKKWRQKRLFWIGLGAIVLAFLGILYVFTLAPNTRKTDGQRVLLIPTGATYEDVLKLMDEQKILKSGGSFRAAATLAGYPVGVHAGRYVIPEGMSNMKLLFKLRNGLQDPVKLTFNSVRTKEKLSEKLAELLEPDKASFMKALNDSVLTASVSQSPETILTLCIPNTYSIYWNTTPEAFIQRMKEEHDRFWNTERTAKAQALGMTPVEVSIMASIVQAETYQNEEKPIVAGLYLNRLRTGWLLQADPTLIFAWQDFSIRRVLKKHKEIDSPYNTYMYPGMPPGPINCPAISSIDAVLNHAKHDYYFMVARPDFLGFHDFYGPDQYRNHVNAGRRYQKKLDQLNIRE